MIRLPATANRSQPRVWLTVALLAYAVVDLQRGAPASHGFDFYQFWLVAQQTGRPNSPNVYDPAARRQIGAPGLAHARSRGGREQAAAEFNAQIYPDLVEPTATPFLYATTRLFVTGDYDRDLARFQLVSNLAAVAGMLLLGRLCGLTLIDAALATGLISVGFSPLRHDLTHANTARLQLFMIALPPLLLLRRGRAPAVRTALAGVVVGLAVMYKPNLALVPLLLLVAPIAQRDLRGAITLGAGMLAGVAAALAIGAAAFGGMSAWPAWMRALRALNYPMEMGNCGGGAVIAALTGARVGIVILLGGLSAAVAVVWRAARPGVEPSLDALFATAVGCNVMLISTSLAWVHYYLLAVPMAFYLLRPPRVGPVARWDVARQFLAVLALSAMARVPITAALGDPSQTQLAVGYVLAATVLLAIGLYDRRLSSRQPPS